MTHGHDPTPKNNFPTNENDEEKIHSSNWFWNGFKWILSGSDHCPRYFLRISRSKAVLLFTTFATPTHQYRWLQIPSWGCLSSSSSLFSTLPMPLPAKETIALMVSFIWNSISMTVAYNTVLISSIFHCFSYNIPIAGLIISGGLTNLTKTSIEIFPAEANCANVIPPFPEPGSNLSSFYPSFS